jgi:RNA polymerase sigma-70 factor (ECF subfamily)
MDQPDATLVQRTLVGERAAFDELVRRYHPVLVRFAALMIGDADEAESLAQEALTQAYAGLASFQTDRPFGAWLRGIALNLCRNHLRDRARHARVTPPEELNATAAREGRRHGVLSGILRLEVNDQILLAIRGLPAPLRETFVLHFVEGFDYPEIGRLTGLAPGTLRVRAHRARVLLQEALGSVVDTWLRQGPGEDGRT